MGKKNRKKTVEEDLSMSDGNDDVDDVDQFYKERDENLRTALSKTSIKRVGQGKKTVSWALDNGMSDDDQNGHDEVLAFDDDEDDENENDYAEINDENEDEDEEIDGEIEDDEVLDGAWGASKKSFYNEDVNGDEEDAKLEEQEAIKIQEKYNKMLKLQDFGFSLFQAKPLKTIDEDNSLRRHVVLPDNLLELSANDRLQLIRDQSPELEILCNEFKTIFDDLKIYLLPLIELINETSSSNEFEQYSGFQFVRDVFELYLVYCSYLSLYLTMKSKDTNLGQHPILNDIEQYRKLTQFVDEDFQKIKGDLLKVRELLQERKSDQNRSTTRKPTTSLINGNSNSTKKKSSLRERMLKRIEDQQEKEENFNVENEIEENDEKSMKKRAITYQIQKNKGLTVKRKKEYRNPRVRNRNKYARALVKRKSRVPTSRTEEERYTGEPTGIRAGIKRSIKLKS